MQNPTRSPRICASPGCDAIAYSGPRCAVCEQERQAARAETRAAFDRKRSRDPHRRIYKTEKWKRGRAAFLSANPDCRHCAELGLIEAATVVDHIVPVRQRPDLAFETSNWQALCASCHSRKTATEDSRFATR